MSCPAKNVSSAKVAFIGLNPGGDKPDLENDGYSSELGTSYRVEAWKNYHPGEAPLQKQVRDLFRLLDLDLNAALTGNLIPFRSQRYSSLSHKKEVLSFSNALWSEILASSSVEFIITMGSGVVTRQVMQIVEIPNLCETSAAWGRVKLRFGRSDHIRMLSLPHLSTFKLMSREASKRQIEYACAQLDLL